MNVEQKRRELFESTTTLPVGVEWNSDSKSYVGPNYWLAEYAWDALNKALDAVEIELPMENERGHITRMSAIRAIESTGLKVKP